MSNELEISEQAMNFIESHAEADYPFECCGFLYGLEDNQRRITLARRVTNAKEGDQRRRFKISPIEYQKAELFADEHELDLLGIYHSHPDHPARPSEHDLKQAMPYFSYIIASVKKGQCAKVTSWQLDDNGQFQEERILIEQHK